MLDRKSEKPLRPLAKYPLFGIPANIAAGPLGFQAVLDVNPKGERTYPHRGLRADRTDPTAISDEKNPNLKDRPCREPRPLLILNQVTTLPVSTPNPAIAADVRADVCTFAR